MSEIFSTTRGPIVAMLVATVAVIGYCYLDDTPVPQNGGSCAEGTSVQEWREVRQHYESAQVLWFEATDASINIIFAALALPVLFLRNVVGARENESILGRMGPLARTGWLFTLLALAVALFHRTAVTCWAVRALTCNMGRSCVTYDQRLFVSYNVLFVVGFVLQMIGFRVRSVPDK